MKIYQNTPLVFKIKHVPTVKIWHDNALAALNGAADLTNPQRLTLNQLITRPYYGTQTRRLNHDDPRIYKQLVHDYRRLFVTPLSTNQHGKRKRDVPSLDQFINQNQTLTSGIVAQNYTPNTLLYLLDPSDFGAEDVRQIDTYLHINQTVSRLEVDTYLGVANDLNKDERYDLSAHLNWVLASNLAAKLQAKLTTEVTPALLPSDNELSYVALAKGEYFTPRVANRCAVKTAFYRYERLISRRNSK